VISRYEAGLYGIGATPELAIGERALLICSSSGNVLWDCLALLDDAIIDFIRALGGLSAIAISHPHFYTTMTEWSRVFGNVPIYLHSSNKNWVKWSEAEICFWDKERISLNNEISLTRVGGHLREAQSHTGPARRTEKEPCWLETACTSFAIVVG
jgi:hypothetical protein